jgi:hypothetical protein
VLRPFFNIAVANTSKFAAIAKSGGNLTPFEILRHCKNVFAHTRDNNEVQELNR